MPSVAYGCCVGSWDRFERYVRPQAGDAPVMAMSGQTSIGRAYNVMLDAYRYGTGSLDAVILQHDDLEILDSAAAIEVFVETFRAEPDVGLIGIAGGSARSGLGWWNCDPVGHQQTDAGLIDFGTRAGDVDLLEGSLLVFSPWAIEALRFWERPGFHGYDEIAMQAARKGMRAVVVDVDTHHHTPLGFDNDASHEDWLAADRWFRQRWSIG